MSNVLGKTEKNEAKKILKIMARILPIIFSRARVMLRVEWLTNTAEKSGREKKPQGNFPLPRVINSVFLLFSRVKLMLREEQLIKPCRRD